MSSASSWIKPSRGGPSISFAPCSTASLQPDWDASTTFVFAAGILQWQNSSRWSPMHAAAENRVDAQFVQFFRECGVPEQHIIYLQDENATCTEVLTSLSHLIQQTTSDATFFFYWAGHGHWEYQTNRYSFVAYDADIGANDCSNHIAMNDVVALFSNTFRGKHVFLLADCCYSGGLCVAANSLSQSTSLNCSMACMTSSYSGSTGNWTFTESLLEVLRGYAHTDVDDDGSVSFADAQTYCELEMAFYEEQKAQFFHTFDFDRHFRLAVTTLPTPLELPTPVSLNMEAQSVENPALKSESVDCTFGQHGCVDDRGRLSLSCHPQHSLQLSDNAPYPFQCSIQSCIAPQATLRPQRWRCELCSFDICTLCVIRHRSIDMASNDESETEGSVLVSNLLETIASFQAEEMITSDPAPSNQISDQPSDQAYLESHMIVPDPGEGKRVEVLWGGKYWRAKTMRRKVDEHGSEWILIKWGSDGWLCTWIECGVDTVTRATIVRPYRLNHFPRGTRVVVERNGDFDRIAVVHSFWYGLHLVRFDDIDIDVRPWMEWVGPSRLQIVPSS